MQPRTVGDTSCNCPTVAVPNQHNISKVFIMEHGEYVPNMRVEPHIS